MVRGLIRRVAPFLALWGVLLSHNPVYAQVYNQFSPGCALSGTGTSQTVNLATGACINGVLASTNAPALTNNAVTVVCDATCGNVTLSGTQTIDGFAGTAGATIALLTAQSTGSQNGPWVEQSGAWTRPVWYPSGGTTQVTGYQMVQARQGIKYQGSTWKQTVSTAITIDTTATTWTQLPLVLSATSVIGTLPNGLIANGSITLAQQANLAANSIECNNTGSPATPLACTAAQTKTLLAIANTDVSGLGTFATANAATPPIIGGTTPANATFATLAATGTISTTSSFGIGARQFESNGAIYNVSGCGTATGKVGGSSAGEFVVGTAAGSCTFVVSLPTSTNGWVINMDDITAGIHCVMTGARSTSSASAICSAVVTGDTVRFGAVPSF